MVKLYASLLALSLATSSALAFYPQPGGRINILRRRELDQELDIFKLDASDTTYDDLEARAFKLKGKLTAANSKLTAAKSKLTAAKSKLSKLFKFWKKKADPPPPIGILIHKESPDPPVLHPWEKKSNAQEWVLQPRPQQPRLVRSASLDRQSLARSSKFGSALLRSRTLDSLPKQAPKPNKLRWDESSLREDNDSRWKDKNRPQGYYVQRAGVTNGILKIEKLIKAENRKDKEEAKKKAKEAAQKA